MKVVLYVIVLLGLVLSEELERYELPKREEKYKMTAEEKRLQNALVCRMHLITRRYNVFHDEEEVSYKSRYGLSKPQRKLKKKVKQNNKPSQPVAPITKVNEQELHVRTPLI